MKQMFLVALLFTVVFNSNAQTKIMDAVKALNNKSVYLSFPEKKPVNFFLEYDDKSKATYACTSGKQYSNLRERVVFLNDYIATLGWVSFEEEGGIITYQTKFMVAHGNKILIGLPMNVKTKTADNPAEFTYADAFSFDDVYSDVPFTIEERKTLATNCNKQIVAALQDIANKTKTELEKLKTDNSLVLIGKLRAISKIFSNDYYKIEANKDMAATIKGLNAVVDNQKQTNWENEFNKKLSAGEYKSIADFAKDLSKPKAAYEFVTISVKYDRDTEKYTYIVGDKVLTRLKEAKITYDLTGKFVKQLELIPEEDNHPKTAHGEVSLRFNGENIEGDDNYLTNGYLLNKRSFAVETGVFFKGYYIIKQQGDMMEGSKNLFEYYYNFFAIRPVGAASFNSSRQEIDKVFSQYSIKERLLLGEKVTF